MKTTQLHQSCGVLLLVLFIGCSASTENPDSTSNGPLNVVCTTNVVKDIVQQVGGSRLNVTAIMDGPGIDPHTYVTTPRDINALTEADVVVYSGLHLEGQFDEALESLEERGIPVICLTEHLLDESPTRLIQSEEGSSDPHVWFDPDVWISCATELARLLGEHDPSYKESYDTNSQYFAAQLIRATQVGRDQLTAIPSERRILVTAHDAFEYFARAFDFQVEAVQGISTESEPGLKRITQLIDLLTEKKISAVFTEQSVSVKNIRALVEGCAAKGHKLKIGGSLFSDTVGAEGTPESTLAGALLHNISEISAALNSTEVSE